MLRLLLALSFMSGCAGAHRWTKTDVALEATFLAATALDGLQSQKFVESCHEENPIIGDCGDHVPLAVYIPVSMVLHAAVTYAIPHGTSRTAFLGLTTGAELDTLYANQFTLKGH